MPKPEPTKPIKRGFPRWLKLGLVSFGMLFPVVILSIILMVKSAERWGIDDTISSSTAVNYGGAVSQPAPSLNALDVDGSYYKELEDERSSYGLTLTQEIVDEFVENTNLKSTNGNVVVNVELVKRGLTFLPTYRTEFDATYTLENTSNAEVAIQFELPFPQNVQDKEITAAKLYVDGVEQDDPVRRELVSNDNCDYEYPYGYEYDEYYYDDYYYPCEDTYQSGLYWEGKIAANQEVDVRVTYNTVGLSIFQYEGLENPEGSQDFNFVMKIVGSRKYNNLGTLSIDTREYIEEDGQNGIVLTWDKPDLFSKPDVQIEVATRTDPSTHLYEIYKIMIPLYIFFSLAVIILVTILDKKFGGVDMIILSLLFAVFFPFLHYLVSFNIDPSAEVLVGVTKAINYSMPLYGAFAIALGVVGGLITYLFGRVSGWKFALLVALPLVLVFLAFFPLAMTLPEYKYLLALIGVVAILGVVVQLRVSKRLTRQTN